MKKVIVTGGLGFIGSNLIDLLIKKNFFVINVDKGYLRLVDNYITESVSPPINSYKINDDRVLIEIDNKKISLLL